MSPAAIAARGIGQSFGGTIALHDVSIEVGRGEFLSLIGPSGCGKSTLLRILGGFDRPDHGHVHIDGVDVSGLPPERRAVNTVFQRGALFPHMTVAENVAYGLRRSGIASAEIAVRVDDALALIRLPGYGARKPAQLSGGQAQRVALARALVNRPKVLLLDEPFSALDLALRKELQLELKRIHRELDCAFVFVTHDQEEALVLSDRIAVMNLGRILQSGDPMTVYNEPGTAFTAGFIGEMNLLQGTVRSCSGGTASVQVGRCTLHARAVGSSPASGIAATVLIRPEHVGIEAPSGSGLPATVEEIVYLGSRWRLRVVAPELGSSLWVETAVVSHLGRLDQGTPVRVTFAPEHSRLLSA